MKRMTFEKWWKTYKPIKLRPWKSTPFGSALYDSWSEKEKEKACQYANANPKSIWTFMEHENRFYIVAGFGLANRIGYFLCKVPFEDECTAPEIALGPFRGKRIRSLGCYF